MEVLVPSKGEEVYADDIGGSIVSHLTNFIFDGNKIGEDIEIETFWLIALTDSDTNNTVISCYHNGCCGGEKDQASRDVLQLMTVPCINGDGMISSQCSSSNKTTKGKEVMGTSPPKESQQQQECV